MSSVASTPRQKFQLNDLNLKFPKGELSLICGKLGEFVNTGLVASHTDGFAGSGKTLMLHAMLGEADLLAGQVISPRSPPDALARLMNPLEDGESWVIPNMCAYVPQTTWLQNATIKENILFNLPLDEQRYQETLEVSLIPHSALGINFLVVRYVLCWQTSIFWRTAMRVRLENEV